MTALRIEKTLEKLQKKLDEHDYYEALMLQHSISNRLVKAQAYDEAIDLFYKGAELFFRHGQSASGGDAALSMLDVYIQAKAGSDDTSLARIIDLLHRFPFAEPSLKTFITKAINWSEKASGIVTGHPLLRHHIGLMYSREKLPYEAEKHLCYGTEDSARVLGTLMCKWASETELSNIPLLAARCILPYLQLKNIKYAHVAADTFLDQLASRKEPESQLVNSLIANVRIFPTLPLLNFLILLIYTCERGVVEFFISLKAHYAESLANTTPSWEPALEQIGVVFFEIRSAKPKNMLADMIGSLFGDSSQATTNSIPDMDLD